MKSTFPTSSSTAHLQRLPAALSATCWLTVYTLWLDLAPLLLFLGGGWWNLGALGLASREQSPESGILSLSSGYQGLLPGKNIHPCLFSSSGTCTHLCACVARSDRMKTPGRVGRKRCLWVRRKFITERAARSFSTLQATARNPVTDHMVAPSPGAPLTPATSSTPPTRSSHPQVGDTTQAYVTASFFPRSRAWQPFKKTTLLLYKNRGKKWIPINKSFTKTMVWRKVLSQLFTHYVPFKSVM